MKLLWSSYEYDDAFLCRGTHLSNPNKGKWYKFNDTVIEEFEMNDASLEAECFGGAYKAKVYDHCKCISYSWANSLQAKYNHFLTTYRVCRSVTILVRSVCL